MNLQAHAINTTLQQEKCSHFWTHFVHGSLIGRSKSISMHTSQYFHRIQFILFIFGKAPHVFHRNPWQCDFPPKGRKEKMREPKGELIRLSDVISQD